MNIEGTYTLQAPPEDVWKSLMDQNIIRQVTPGIERFEALGDNKYLLVMSIKHAPLKGSYQCQITIFDQDYPHRYRLQMEGEGRYGKVSAEGVVTLQGHEDNTIVLYQGSLTLDKQSTLVPVTLEKGAAKLLIQQFFLALAEELRARQPRPTSEEVELIGIQIIEQGTRGQIALLPDTESQQPTFLHTLVHTLQLGEGDPVREERWVRGLRRASITSALLFLVWVGTRLPRR